MGTLLAMILSMSMMTGCGHTQNATTTAVQITVLPLSNDTGIEPRSRAEARDTTVVQGPPPLPALPLKGAAPRDPTGKTRKSKDRWVPEPVAPQQYFNSGGLHRSGMGWR